MLREASGLIRTRRLLLRRWQPADVDGYAELCADPQVMRYLGGPLGHQDAASQIERFEDHWRRHGHGLWATELLDGGAFIGFVGLARPEFLPEVMPAVEVGFRLARPHWGQGYATEGARACLGQAFGPLGLDRVVSIRHADNIASGRVVEKLGMRLDRTTTHPVSGAPLVVTALARAQWQR